MNYVKDSFEELRKVTWPTKQQAIRLTILVLGFCFAAAAIIGLLDFVLNSGYRALVDTVPPAVVEETPLTTNPISEVQVSTQESTQQGTQQTSQVTQATSQTQQ